MLINQDLTGEEPYRCRLTMGGGNKFDLFGFTTSTDVVLATTALLIIVLYLVVAEISLHALDSMFQSSAYKEMMQCLYRELVIMGFSSFILGMIIFSNSSNSKLVIYVVSSPVLRVFLLFIRVSLMCQEMAELILFFTTIFHVLLSVIMIVMNSFYFQKLRATLALSLDDLIVSCCSEILFNVL